MNGDAFGDESKHQPTVFLPFVRMFAMLFGSLVLIGRFLSVEEESVCTIFVTNFAGQEEEEEVKFTIGCSVRILHMFENERYACVSCPCAPVPVPSYPNNILTNTQISMKRLWFNDDSE
jgi:hypothetical protein